MWPRSSSNCSTDLRVGACTGSQSDSASSTLRSCALPCLEIVEGRSTMVLLLHLQFESERARPHDHAMGLDLLHRELLDLLAFQVQGVVDHARLARAAVDDRLEQERLAGLEGG